MAVIMTEETTEEAEAVGLNNVSLRIGVVEVGLSSMDIDVDVLADVAYELVCGLVELAERMPREMRAGSGIY